MIFCAKFYFSAQIATMVIGNANPECFSSHDLKMAAPAMENDEKKFTENTILMFRVAAFK